MKKNISVYHCRMTFYLLICNFTFPYAFLHKSQHHNDRLQWYDLPCKTDTYTNTYMDILLLSNIVWC